MQLADLIRVDFGSQFPLYKLGMFRIVTCRKKIIVSKGNPTKSNSDAGQKSARALLLESGAAMIAK